MFHWVQKRQKINTHWVLTQTIFFLLAKNIPVFDEMLLCCVGDENYYSSFLMFRKPFGLLWLMIEKFRMASRDLHKFQLNIADQWVGFIIR